eukprot:jgi/Psemu1/10740/gm1.10740_g
MGALLPQTHWDYFTNLGSNLFGHVTSKKSLIKPTAPNGRTPLDYAPGIPVLKLARPKAILGAVERQEYIPEPTDKKEDAEMLKWRQTFFILYDLVSWVNGRSLTPRQAVCLVYPCLTSHSLIQVWASMLDYLRITSTHTAHNGKAKADVASHDEPGDLFRQNTELAQSVTHALTPAITASTAHQLDAVEGCNQQTPKMPKDPSLRSPFGEHCAKRLLIMYSDGRNRSLLPMYGARVNLKKRGQLHALFQNQVDTIADELSYPAPLVVTTALKSFFNFRVYNTDIFDRQNKEATQAAAADTMSTIEGLYESHAPTRGIYSHPSNSPRIYFVHHRPPPLEEATNATLNDTTSCERLAQKHPNPTPGLCWPRDPAVPDEPPEPQLAPQYLEHPTPLFPAAPNPYRQLNSLHFRPKRQLENKEDPTMKNMSEWKIARAVTSMNERGRAHAPGRRAATPGMANPGDMMRNDEQSASTLSPNEEHHHPHSYQRDRLDNHIKRPRIDVALVQGPHQFTHHSIGLLKEEYSDMMDKQQQWRVLMSHLIWNFPDLCISPLGSVPKRERRGRMISDSCSFGMNAETLQFVPLEAMMQFEQTITRMSPPLADSFCADLGSIQKKIQVSVTEAYAWQKDSHWDQGLTSACQMNWIPSSTWHATWSPTYRSSMPASKMDAWQPASKMSTW